MVAVVSIGSGLMLWSGLLAVVSCSADQQVLASDAPQPSVTADPSVLSSYSNIFSDWESSTKIHAHKTLGRCTGCNQAPGCCPPGGWAGLPTVQIPIGPLHTPQLPATSSWETFSLPTTVTSQSPSRTTIYRPVNTMSDAQQSAPTAEPVQAEKKVAAAAAASSENLKDITSSYYDFTIAGQHPFELPLLIEDGYGTPVTLLAFADTEHSISFISSSLVAQLNLTSKIVTQGAGTVTPDQMTQMLGIHTSTPGDIYLDLMVGKNDRRMAGSRFTVFEPKHEVEGPLSMDVSVGMNFLNRAGAIQLTDEYAGVGAKAGLGIVVQRVFVDGSSAPAATKERVRDEL